MPGGYYLLCFSDPGSAKINSVTLPPNFFPLHCIMHMISLIESYHKTSLTEAVSSISGLYYRLNIKNTKSHCLSSHFVQVARPSQTTGEFDNS